MFRGPANETDFDRATALVSDLYGVFVTMVGFADRNHGERRKRDR